MKCLILIALVFSSCAEFTKIGVGGKCELNSQRSLMFAAREIREGQPLKGIFSDFSPDVISMCMQDSAYFIPRERNQFVVHLSSGRKGEDLIELVIRADQGDVSYLVFSFVELASGQETDYLNDPTYEILEKSAIVERIKVFKR